MSDAGTNFCFRKIETLLQINQHRASCIIGIPPSKQQAGQSLHQIYKVNIKKNMLSQAGTKT